MTEQIWHQFHQQLLNFILSKVQDQHIAEDILQDVFIKVQQKLSTLENANKLQAWLYQVCRNSIIDYYRSNNIQFTPLVLDAAIPVEQNDSDLAQLSRCLQILINDLPADTAPLLVASDLEQIKQQVIAKQYQLSLSATKSRIQRARSQLKDKLQQCCDFEFNEQGPQMHCKRQCGCQHSN
ncbi:sigma-70 family RNA polymerase sigma factor [Catenovulum sp. SM1970]|uniref:sigma-70 family RNA polymerase sigma factor n=1 Tax=Marinifaba aquimaris TaxID=2741323 RepID=UPI0015736F6E|nr:sigma-70 family RNA polymerase sigma factor [Marinifaba aquimaris]NTS75852.1 sigma-70 family RNA polymerase sigma factor [Marinifaba aquimaris]